MMNSVLKDLVPIVTIVSTTALPIGMGIYVAIQSSRQRHKENMELIKQGIVPERQVKGAPNRLRSLRNGILLVGLALGFIFSYLITGSGDMDTLFDNHLIIVASSVLLCLGIAYIVYFVLSRYIKDTEDRVK